MPLFDFRCLKCGKTKEVIVKLNGENPVCVCGYVMKKQIGKSNFLLKGSGWFKDGYGNSK